MNRFLRTLGLVSVLVFALAGCNNAAEKLAGQYTGKINLSPKTQEGMQKKGAQGQKDLKTMTSLSMDLDLRKDKTYTLATSGALGKSSESGTWSAANNQITLTPGNGNPAYSLRQDDETKLLVLDSGAMAQSGMIITFARKG